MIKNIWKALFESSHMQLKELKERVKAMEAKLIELAMHSHEPQNYKKKCDEMEERIEALEKKTTMFR
jgi:sugar phosphate isomerase/epimerase